MANNEEELRDLVEMEDEDGNTVTLEVMRYFFYNGDEYVVLNELQDEEEADEDEARINCYIMQVVESQDGDEETEEFLPIEDDALFNKLVEVAQADYEADQDFDE